MLAAPWGKAVLGPHLAWREGKVLQPLGRGLGVEEGTPLGTGRGGGVDRWENGRGVGKRGDSEGSSALSSVPGNICVFGPLSSELAVPTGHNYQVTFEEMACPSSQAGRGWRRQERLHCFLLG
jgi:hypothetical protein